VLDASPEIRASSIRDSDVEDVVVDCGNVGVGGITFTAGIVAVAVAVADEEDADRDAEVGALDVLGCMSYSSLTNSDICNKLSLPPE